MTNLHNEELAIKIQQGQIEYYTELWENIKDLIALMANKIFTLNSDKCISAGVTVEDIIQSGFIALTEAVKAFDIESGYKLSAYISYPLKNQINILLCRRSSYRDGLNNSTSLDTPVGNDTEDITIGDALPDVGAVTVLETIEDNIFNAQLREALIKEINLLSEPEQNIIFDRHFALLKFSDICQKENIPEWKAKNLYTNALHKLRSERHKKALRPFADEVFGRALKNTGLSAFKHQGASSVELTAEWLSFKELYK